MGGKIMASKQKTASKVPALTEVAKNARSLAVAEKGLHTAGDCANFFSALMSDIIEGEVSPRLANVVSNELGKRLQTAARVVTLVQRKKGGDKDKK
jgi:hypothetical protein